MVSKRPWSKAALIVWSAQEPVCSYTYLVCTCQLNSEIYRSPGLTSKDSSTLLMLTCRDYH
jgi:hypothetical protein